MASTNKTNKKIKLTIMERLALTAILPVQGNFVTLRLIKSLNEKLSLTEKEVKDFNVKITPGENNKVNFQMDYKGMAHIRDFDFTTMEKSEIKLALETLSKKDQLNIEHLNLCEYFEVTE